MMEVCVLNDGHTHETVGMLEQWGFELSATVDDLKLRDECDQFIRTIAEYVASGNSIRSGETVAYGYWLTKAILSDHGRMIFHEYNPDATEFIFGLDHTLFYWHGQHQICELADAQFTPPRADQLIVISDGLYEGDDVEGVRYPSPEHMSGWWLTTDKYNGDIKSLKTVHAHHVTSKRPDLAKFLALPNGYRFFSPNSEVWFDQKVVDK